MSARFLLLASSSGFLAVVLGAFGAHGLEQRLDADALTTWATAVDYHMYHSLALLLVAVIDRRLAPSTLVTAAGYLFVLGIVIFSGSLYLLSVSGLSWLGAITPIGGLAFLAGWGCLFRFGLTAPDADG